MPTTAATTLRKGKDEPMVIDGPFAETKEQLLGFFVSTSRRSTRRLPFRRNLRCQSGAGSYEIRPLYVFRPGAIAT